MWMNTSTCAFKEFFFTSEQSTRYNLWSCQKICDALHYLHNILRNVGSKLFRQPEGIRIGINCVLLLQICFCFASRETLCCTFLTKIKLMLLKHLTLPQDVDDLLHIDTPYFE